MDLEDIFSLSSESPLTRSNMENSWLKNFPTVMPVPVILNPNDPSFRVTREKNSSPAFREVFDHGYIVPFAAALEQILNIPSVFEATMANFNFNTLEPATVYADVWDGTYIKSNPLYIQHHGRVLGVQIYTDDVELANPLGSKKGKHKVSVFYWSLLNLPPQCRSSLQSINLLGVVNSDLLRIHGATAFLQPFIDDMLRLQSGLKLKVNGKEETWHGILVNSVGDMPASNLLGGFKEGVGRATRPCRRCMVHREEMNLIHHESDCELRSKNQHQQHLTELLESENLSKTARDALSASFGVNGPSPLSALDYFDPVSCFPQDLMHVLYEGVLNRATCFLLHHLITKKDLDLNQLNNNISSLKNQREFTTPPRIREDEVMNLGKLSFSSSEMECLCVALPLVLGNTLLCQDSPHYDNFILLLEICASLQCYSFNEDQLRVLQFDIETHNSHFVLLYSSVLQGGRAITPKFHVLLHLMAQIRAFGPPRFCWCFRFESKNAPLKKIMRRNCNFHNVCWTIASHQQKLQGLLIRTESGDFFGVRNDFKTVSFQKSFSALHRVSISPWAPILTTDCALNIESSLRTLKSSKVSGRLCYIGTVFLRDLPTWNTMPVFFRVADMSLHLESSRVIFIMEAMKTIRYDREHFSFLAKPLKLFTAIVDENLQFNVPLQSFANTSVESIINVIPNYYYLL